MKPLVLLKMNVFQIYLTDEDEKELPPLLAARSNTIKSLFAGCNYRLYTNSSLREFISENYPSDVLAAYDMLLPYSYKADLGRFCLVNKLGGWYFDIALHTDKKDCLFTQPVDMVVFSDRQKYTNSIWSAYTAAFFSKPNTPVLEKAIQMIVENCKNRYYGKTALDPTGPNLFGRAIALTRDDNIIIHYGCHMELTPGFVKENCALVLPDGTILAYGKNMPGGDLTLLGGKGVNNYGTMWVERRVFKDN